MAEDINRVIMIGRLTRDAELTFTQSGTGLCKMAIAVNETVKKGDEWVEYVSFFDLNLWGKRAENLTQYLKKGQRISVDAKAKQERWENEGQKRSKIVFNVNKLQLLDGKNDNNSQY